MNQGSERKADKIRVVIADDHPIVRNALKDLLSLEEDIELVGEAQDGQELLEVVQQQHPDVVLLDLRMPTLDGLGAAQALRQLHREIKIIILTASEDKAEFHKAMKMGCQGIVLKQTPPELIVKSIRKVHAGEIWLDAYTTAALIKEFSQTNNEAVSVRARDRSPLSAREREIVCLVAQGYKNKEMAEKMNISEQTVKNHLHNIFDKLGVSDRLELALYAISKGLHVMDR